MSLRPLLALDNVSLDEGIKHVRRAEQRYGTSISLDCGGIRVAPKILFNASLKSFEVKLLVYTVSDD
jgi:hypothetical protein